MAESTALENGLLILTENVPSARSVSIGILVDAGPQNDPDDRLGLAHFVEHAVFQGTSERDAAAISRFIDEAGGQLGAFTSRDYTCYYAHIMQDYCPFAWELLGDILLNSTFPHDAMEKEREVILQELAIAADRPASRLNDLLKRTIWKDHPVGRPVAGLADDVSRFTREDVIYFVGQNYLPDRMIVVAVGNVDHEETVRQAEDAFWRLLGQSRPRDRKPCDFHSAEVFETGTASHSHFALAFPAGTYRTEDRYSMHALCTLLGGGMSSRLYRSLRDHAGVAYDVHAAYHAYRDAGAVMVEGITQPNALTQAVMTTMHELEDIAAHGVSEDELWRTQMQVRGQHQLASDSIHTRMSRLMTQKLYFSECISESQILDALAAVSSASVQACAQELIESGNRGIAVAASDDSRHQMDLLRDHFFEPCVTGTFTG